MDTEKEEIDVEGIKLLSREQLEMTGLKKRQIRIKVADIPNLVKVVSRISGEEDLLALVESQSEEKKAFIKSSTDKIRGAVRSATLVVLREEEQA